MQRCLQSLPTSGESSEHSPPTKEIPRQRPSATCVALGSRRKQTGCSHSNPRRTLQVQLPAVHHLELLEDRRQAEASSPFQNWGERFQGSCSYERRCRCPDAPIAHAADSLPSPASAF